MEITRIPDHPEYGADIYGNVYSFKYGNTRKMKIARSDKGYCYVILQANGKRTKQYVHRIMLETFVGRMPSGKEVLHLNDIKADNRLDNLKYGTHLENVRMGRVTKFKVKDVDRIRQLHREGETQAKIAKMFDVHYSTICRIVNNNRWVTRIEATL